LFREGPPRWTEKIFANRCRHTICESTKPTDGGSKTRKNQEYSMLEKLGGSHDRDDLRDNDLRDGTLLDADRQRLVRERMEAHGVTEDEALRLVLSEEELAIGKRQVAAGEVGVHKTVETRHVHENVALRHEEVDVERRPITDGYSAAGATIGQDENIRIPLHAEEAIVEKRVVPTEEIVVRKREVVENEGVDATLRRERAEVDREVTDTHLRDGMRNDLRDDRI
jgi:uncharacterized protein (TIGR02271 family)